MSMRVLRQERRPFEYRQWSVAFLRHRLLSKRIKGKTRLEQVDRLTHKYVTGEGNKSMESLLAIVNLYWSQQNSLFLFFLALKKNVFF